jgi:hypothetical protein
MCASKFRREKLQWRTGTAIRTLESLPIGFEIAAERESASSTIAPVGAA